MQIVKNAAPLHSQHALNVRYHGTRCRLQDISQRHGTPKTANRKKESVLKDLEPTKSVILSRHGPLGSRNCSRQGIWRSLAVETFNIWCSTFANTWGRRHSVAPSDRNLFWRRRKGMVLQMKCCPFILERLRWRLELCQELFNVWCVYATRAYFGFSPTVKHFEGMVKLRSSISNTNRADSIRNEMAISL